MNKFLRIFLIIICVVATLITTSLVLLRICGDKLLCSYADNLMKKNDYVHAYVIYDAISLYKPDNSDYKYKQTKCLTKMPYTYSVQKKLLEIAQSDNKSSAEKLATNKITNIRKAVFKKFGENYIKEAVGDGAILHWSKESFPLKYYVEQNDSVPQYYISETDNSFQAWQRESDNFVSFTKVNNPVSADITVKFRPTATGNSEHSQGEYEIAITTPKIEKEQILKQMNIVCSIKSHNDRFLTQQQMKTVMTHEIGHALGIWGHPKDNKTVMYYSMDNPYDFYEKRIDTSITSKDINTIKFLYVLAPSITNTKKDIMNKEKFIYPPFLFEPLDDADNQNIKTAQNALLSNPEDLGAAFSLADAYNAAGKYKESIDLMLLLAEKNQDVNLKNILFYNIANNYINLRDFEKAMEYANKAKAISNNPDNSCLIAYIKYCKGDLASAEKEFIYILGKNPAHTNSSLGLTDVYIKQKKYSQARKVLKEMLKYNPNALDDKTLNGYKLLTMF